MAEQRLDLIDRELVRIQAHERAGDRDTGVDGAERAAIGDRDADAAALLVLVNARERREPHGLEGNPRQGPDLMDQRPAPSM